MAINATLSKIISFAASKGFQIHPDALILFENMQEDVFSILDKILTDKKGEKKSTVVNCEDLQNFINYLTPKKNQTETVINNTNYNINTSIITQEKDNNRLKFEKKNTFEIYSAKDSISNDSNNLIKIIYDSNNNINSGEGIEGYTSLFRSRYEKSIKILAQRPDSKKIKKIGLIKQLLNQSKINTNSDGDNPKEYTENSIFVAGLVMDKRIKKNSYEVTIDDYTGLLDATAYSEELRKQASLLTFDQMVMLEIENNSKRRGYAIKNLFSLDIPDRIPNRSKSETYSVLISDLHIGSKFFMEKEFHRFLEWLNGNLGDKDIVSKIKYICICGDLIDGIGIFPNQDKELLEKESYLQMEHAINILSNIPKHMKIFLIPGNHDLGRRALPQPAIPKKYAEKLYSLENISMLGNPCMINMDGIKTLMFHGQSLDDVIATIPGLSYSKPAEAMKILLKSRHLSPIYGHRTPIAPELEDMMVIEEVPDILHSGHVHVIDVDSYKGTLIVNSGAWQTQTPFQQTMGITPTPGIAIIINLETLKPYQINFSDI